MRSLTSGVRPFGRRLPIPCSRALLGLSLLCLLSVALSLGGAAFAQSDDEPSAVQATRNLPAFPGAEGYGAVTPGGRGGKILFVTNLNDSGAGSLRAALEAGGRRIVVFAVGGVIRLSSMISIEQPYLTIAGQSAPGDGIVLRGAGIRVRTHDVIVRGLRFRIGDDSGGAPPITRDGITVTGPDPDGNPPRNIIIDHCSISWAIDENSGVAGAEDVTIQWSLISEGLNNSIHAEPHHSNALLIAENARRISIHHNLLAHHWYRNPLVKGGTEAEFVNNVVYNWGAAATLFEDGSKAGPTRSVVARNVYKRGPSTESETAVRIHKSVGGGSQIFVIDNSGDNKLVADLPVLAGEAPLTAPTLPIAASGPYSVFDTVLFGAGANAPSRDAIDHRVVAEVRTGSGRIIDSVAEVGGWDVLAGWSTGVPLDDADLDGMPDGWERERGLSPADPADAAGLAPSGYTWVEEYLNGLMPRSLAARVFIPLVSR